MADIISEKDLFFVQQTIKLAQKSVEMGHDPFGAILVKNGLIEAKTADKSIIYSDPTAHAELILISEFCRKNKFISLKGFTLYTNVEPCIMCSGAIHWAKISRVVFGLSQATLQSFSGGKSKPGCRDLINSGGKTIEVIGPVREAEGLKVFEENSWQSKKARHQTYWKK